MLQVPRNYAKRVRLCRGTLFSKFGLKHGFKLVHDKLKHAGPRVVYPHMELFWLSAYGGCPDHTRTSFV